MKTQALNVFILNDNTTIADKLKQFLIRRFGNKLNISLFSTSENFFNQLNKNVDLVVLDDYLYDEVTHSGADVTALVKKIKELNDKAEVIVLSSEADSPELGSHAIIPNKRGAWSKVHLALYKIANYPISFLVNEFKVSKFVAIFTMTFLTMAAVVLITLHFYK
jgi:response regulator RpfG family c-di-GMP phosphodiesterase